MASKQRAPTTETNPAPTGNGEKAEDKGTTESQNNLKGTASKQRVPPLKHSPTPTGSGDKAEDKGTGNGEKLNATIDLTNVPNKDFMILELNSARVFQDAKPKILPINLFNQSVTWRCIEFFLTSRHGNHCPFHVRQSSQRMRLIFELGI
ncbi:hypothetical protein KEM48_003257 [Puccinia striiformis f. sp. tritici PST-130]|nr:hypothetical protein KEM48_003257 [Puccinia striiformis f. sp. tritici PST-130]